MVFLNSTYRPGAAVVLVLMIWGVSFFLHFFWEMVQVPFFTDMTEARHLDVVWLCTRATIGDANIAIGAYAVAALISRDWFWAVSGWRRTSLSVYLAGGLVVTIVFEYWATGEGERWNYSELMPVLSWTGTGVLPLAQWVFLPLLTVLVVEWMFLGWLTLRAK
ncbi:hypothetical protein J3362_13525 [Marinobacter sp. NFXS11]|uniref:hypothetical protein n=1 Tax=unclassified Marinobacter TaxID=83889 RepID=UPI000C8B3890|nr:hypothetical protein [Marinobacter sp. 3-2]MAI30754.1 hypothetical protein [Rhodopirellula sp.]ROQ43348.1 hypothetical protein EDB94_2804 [Marinobacter sp. 3-2]